MKTRYLLIISNLFLFNLIADSDFGTKIIKIEIPGYRQVNYALWMHPLQATWTLDFFFNKNFLDKMRLVIPQGSVVIDIGAHVGDSSVAFSMLTGDSGKVIAFEPSPKAFEVLKINSSLNSNIIPVNLAISEKDGVFKFEYSDEGLFNGGFSNNGKYDVKGVNLEKWLKNNHPELIDRIKFIKIDAEGYDLNIFRSILELIKRQRPFIEFEIYPNLERSKKMEFFNLLDSMKYDCYLAYVDFLNDKSYKTYKLNRDKFLELNAVDVLCFPR